MIKIGPSFSAIITRTDRWIVSLSGEIDAAARSELLSLAELLSKLGGSIDFDLTEVSFIDAAGWASVRAGSDAASASGSSTRIINPSPTVSHPTDVIARSHARRGASQRPTDDSPLFLGPASENAAGRAAIPL